MAGTIFPHQKRTRKPEIGLPFPTLTVTLVISMVITYLARNVIFQLARSEFGMFIVWLVHPIAHNSYPHLVGNLIWLTIMGLLAESWMRDRSRRYRYGVVFGASYVSSLIVGLVGWKLVSGCSNLVPIGMSAVIFSSIPFLLLHYKDKVTAGTETTPLDKAAPILIGLLLAPSVLPLLEALVPALDTLSFGSLIFGCSLILHPLAVVVGLGFALLLHRRIR